MVIAARYAREEGVPFLGICMGMQAAVIEFARNVAGLAQAGSGEFDEACPQKVIDFMPGQSADLEKGGTLRLGAYPCAIAPGSVLERCYGERLVAERHRHRLEVSDEFRAVLVDAGLRASGTSPDGRLVEAVELPDEPFFVGVQYHPEFKSRPTRPHPLFRGFVGAACARSQEGA